MDYGEAIPLFFWGWGRSSYDLLAIFREFQPANKKQRANLSHHFCESHTLVRMSVN